MKKLLITSVLCASLCFSLQSQAQQHNENVWEEAGMCQDYRYNIRIPDILGYKTLKGDFHVHTMFSDGLVWPSERVVEAWAGGLDFIFITDHLEKQRYGEYLKYDLNTSTDLAIKKGKEIGFLVLRGAEITRKKPFGHMNALFVKDANLLKTETPEQALEEALKQGCFVQWNHPGWPNDTTTLYPMHEQWIKEKKIHGVEVFNGREAYPIAMDWVNQFGLTAFSNTDIHAAAGAVYRQKLERPMTLVFAKDCTEEALREAIFAGRTLAYYWHQLSGQEKYMQAMVAQCIKVKVINAKKNWVEISNVSDIDFKIQFGKLEYAYPIAANETIRVTMKPGELVTFTNCFIGKFKNYATVLVK